MDLTQVSQSPSSRPQKALAGESLNIGEYDERPFLKRLRVVDWLVSLALVAGARVALSPVHELLRQAGALLRGAGFRGARLALETGASADGGHRGAVAAGHPD